MCRRRDFHRLLRDVEHLILDELAVHPGELLEDLVLRSMRDVKEDAAVGAAAALHDLRVDLGGRRIIKKKLHPFRVIALHEPLVTTVVEAAGLAAVSTGGQGTRD